MTAPASISFIDQAIAELDAIEVGLLALLDISEIRYVNMNPPGQSITIVAPDWRWGPSDEAQSLARMELARRFGPWRQRVKMLEGRATHELRKQLRDGLVLVDRWINRPSGDWSLPHTIPDARRKASQHVEQARVALRLLGQVGAGGVHLVPDTSALIDQPDLATYGAAAGVEAATIHLVPMVLSEIDALKDQGRTADVRERAAKLTKRIKGLRDRGRLSEGVTVAGRLTAIADPRDPSFEHLPDWLDPSTPDDRILASALALQAANPSSVVVLVARDMNIQNKAEMLGLPYCEPVPVVSDEPP